MQYLKRAWNYWMDLDTGAWVDRIPDRVRIAVLSLGYVLITISLFWVSWSCLDLRYPMSGQNHSEMSVWMRIPFGLLGGAAALYLTALAFDWLRDQVRVRSKGLSAGGSRRR